MAKSRWKYYVAVEFEYENKPKDIRYVTSVYNSTEFARWDYGETALQLSLSYAEQLVFGLVCNYFRAYIIKAPCTFVFKNPPKKED